MAIFETERLKLRLPKLSDQQFFIELMNSPGWLQYIGERNIKTAEDAQHHIQDLLDNQQRDGYGFYVIESKYTNEKIGTAGLIKREHLDHLDIGFAILPQHFRQGYTLEASRRILSFAMDELKQDVILGITALDNQASQNLLIKLGLEYQGTIDFKGQKSSLFKIEKSH